MLYIVSEGFTLDKAYGMERGQGGLYAEQGIWYVVPGQ